MELQHYGMPRRSGRYPWGSGEDPYHHGADKRGKRIAKKIASKSVKAEIKQKKKEAKILKKQEKKNQKLAKHKIQTDEHKVATQVKVSHMSDTELQAAINRLRMEKTYKELLAEQNPKKQHEVKQLIKEAGKSSLKNSLSNVGTQTLNYVMGKAVNKLFDDEVYKRKKEK